MATTFLWFWLWCSWEGSQGAVMVTRMSDLGNMSDNVVWLASSSHDPHGAMRRSADDCKIVGMPLNLNSWFSSGKRECSHHVGSVQISVSFVMSEDLLKMDQWTRLFVMIMMAFLHSVVVPKHLLVHLHSNHHLRSWGVACDPKRKYDSRHKLWNWDPLLGVQAHEMRNTIIQEKPKVEKLLLDFERREMVQGPSEHLQIFQAGDPEQRDYLSSLAWECLENLESVVDRNVCVMSLESLLWPNHI